MKKLSFVFLWPLILQAHSLNGVWTSELQGATVKIKITQNEVMITECKSACRQMQWELRANEEIWNHNRQVGDLFPYQLLIFEGNGQVSELVRIAKRSPTEIVYLYSYSNQDGEGEFLKAVMTQEKK